MQLLHVMPFEIPEIYQSLNGEIREFTNTTLTQAGIDKLICNFGYNELITDDLSKLG